MIQVRLTKMSDNPNALRTESVEGVLAWTPHIGKALLILGKPLREGDIRAIKTTPVIRLFHEPLTDMYMARTENSTYLVELLDEYTDRDIEQFIEENCELISKLIEIEKEEE